MSYNHRKTQMSLARLEAELTKHYREAYKGIEEKVARYLKRFEKEDKRLQGLLKDGEITQKYYKDWKKNQIAQGRRWESLKGEIAQRMTHTNETAADIINGKLSSVYAFNETFQMFTASKMAGGSFSVVDDKAMLDIVKGKNHSEFKVLTVDPVRDYNWNYNRIQNSVVQGILQGDSIGELTKRFYDVQENNLYAAYRNARTAYTSAANAGTQHAQEEIENLGYEVESVWMATVDNRTRESHAELHGVAVPQGELFPNGLMYPCDPDGDPSEVYNCRCTMVTHIVGVNDSIMDNFPKTEEGMDLLYEKNPKYASMFTDVEGKTDFLNSFMNNDVNSYKEWLQENAPQRIINDLMAKGLI